MSSGCVGVVVRSDPYRHRAGRERLDFALVAASLDIPLRVFFIGDGVLQLQQGQTAEALPAAPWTRGWGALADLSDEVELYADQNDLEGLSLAGKPRLLPLKAEEMALKMRQCGLLIHV